MLNTSQREKELEKLCQEMWKIQLKKANSWPIRVPERENRENQTVLVISNHVKNYPKT